MIRWLKNLNLNECLGVIFNSYYIILWNYILNGMILKRKRLKGVIILKIWISKYFRFFWIFPEFILMFNRFLNLQKRCLFPQDRGADMASTADVAHGTRADATLHARPCGRDERGPRGEPRWLELTRTRDRGHTSPRGPPRGHHVASEEASIWRAHGLVGPGEMIWAVTQMRYAPLCFIQEFSSLFLRVGLCSRRTLSLCRTPRRKRRVGCDCDDGDVSIAWTWVHPIIIMTRAQKMGISEIRRSQLNPIEAHRGDTWTHHDGPIFIGRAKHAKGVGRDLRSWETRGHMMSLRSSSDGSRQRKTWTTSWATIPTVLHDRTAQIASHNGRLVFVEEILL